MQTYELAVIGGGPAGYSGAIHAAKKGVRVVIIEQADVGGTCLNRGCIPSKVMLEAAALLQYRKSYVNELAVDHHKLFQHRASVIRKLRKGIEYLLRNNKITLIQGKAIIIDSHTIEVRTSDHETRIIHTNFILLATGSRPKEFAPLQDHPEYYLNSDAATQIQTIPKSITILGGGAVGVEFAYIFRALGSDVTLIEMMDRLLPGEDIEISQSLQRKLEGMGIKMSFGKNIENTYIEGDGVTVLLDGSAVITSEKLFSSIGREPNTKEMELEKCGVAIGDRAQIVVDDYLQTSVPTIYAAGDVTGRIMLAHAASSQAVTAVNNMFSDSNQRWDGSAIPRCIYITPEIACVGLTEQEAKLRLPNIKTATMPYKANGKAVATDEDEGFIKVIANDNNQMIGIHIFGPRATDIISQASLYISHQFDVDEVTKQIYPHPTYSEALYEAILNVDGKAVHL